MPRSALADAVAAVAAFALAGGATLREVSLAGARFVDVPADFQRQPQPGAGSDLAGRIGMGLLRRFRVIFDAPHGRLYLAPPADTAAPFAKDRTGLAVAPEAGVLVVKLVVAGSPAAAAGFKVGDSIAAVDGKAAGDWTLFQLQDAFDQPAGASVRLRLSGGEERVLKLADYY